MNSFILKATLAIAFCVGLFASQAIAVEVDCSENQSLQQAVDTAPPANGEIYTIHFQGTCEETVTIRRDNTWFDGGGIGTISGTIRVFNSDSVRLINLTVTGPGNGLIVNDGEAQLFGVTVTGNELNGISARRQGSVWVTNGTIISANGNSGAYLDAAILDVNDATFEGNTVDGILAVSGSKVILANARILGNQGAGVAVTLHSIVDIRSGSLVAGNGQAHRGRGYGGLGVLARLDSGVWISQENVEITDRIVCKDFESSFHTDHEWPAGLVYCSGFNW